MNRRCFHWSGLILVTVLCGSLAAADPITRSARLPEHVPWDLARLSESPEFEWVDGESPVRSLLFAGERYGGQPTRVFAYYATPATVLENAASDASPWPAVVLVHGGGGTAFREWVELWARRGYAAIAMDLAGYRPIEGQNPHQREHRERLSDGGPDQGDEEKFGRIDEPIDRQWPYHAVANVLRAHSLVRSFPEVDATRTAVTGISWGGYLTCIVAGLDNRFSAAVPVYGCGYLHDNSAWLDRFARMDPEQRERWIELWDPSRYLPAVTMPVLFVNGTNDFAYPLDSYMKSFDLVSGAKQIRVTVDMPHGHPQGWAPDEIGWFVDHHLRGEPSLPIVGVPCVEGDRIGLNVEGPMALRDATLHFTTDGGAINGRTWQHRPAAIDGCRVTVDAPPADTTAWFLTVTDQRGAVVSTRVVVP
jgi:dienelactone hydrolase